MLNAAVVSAITGVSSVLSLLALLAYLFLLLQLKRDRHSVKDAVEGEGLFKGDQVISILAQFKDDTARLEALQALTNHDERKAQVILRKVKGNVDLARFRRLSNGAALKLSGTSALFFLLIAVVGLLYARQVPPSANDAAVAAPTPARGTTAVATPSVWQQVSPSVEPAEGERQHTPRRTPKPHRSPTETVRGSDFAGDYEGEVEVAKGTAKLAPFRATLSLHVGGEVVGGRYSNVNGDEGILTGSLVGNALNLSLVSEKTSGGCQLRGSLSSDRSEFEGIYNCADDGELGSFRFLRRRR